MADESRDFTPWLAAPENLTLLGNALGLALEPRGTEQAVGGFSADILCRRLDGGGADDAWVLIENQYGRTDHDHLGKLLTYAAGLNARTSVWIAEEFRDEHRAALDLLNASTTRDYAYFGVEIELLKIDDSKPAARFNIAVQPNYWTRTVRRDSELSKTQVMHLNFWTEFQVHMETGSDVPCGHASASPYMWHNTGVSSIQVRSVFSTWNTPKSSWASGELRVEMTFSGTSAQSLFERLSAARKDLEREADQRYSWFGQTEGTNPRVFVQRDANVGDLESWPEYQDWLKTKVERMFRSVVPRALTLSD